jgi:hypothetical protein
MEVKISSAIVNIVILTIILGIKGAASIVQDAKRALTPLGPVSVAINIWNTKPLSYIQYFSSLFYTFNF